jgi:uncharacterized membrane protein
MKTMMKSESKPLPRRFAAQSSSTRREILNSRESHHPAVVAIAAHHAADVQLRIADTITAFAGSMRFVYIHVVLFAVWMVWFEKSPWPTLTLVVSLEAIFLSTFVMIGQNRQSAFQQIKADHEFDVQEKELDENTVLTREIHRLTVELHEMQAKQGTLNPPPA